MLYTSFYKCLESVTKKCQEKKGITIKRIQKVGRRNKIRREKKNMGNKLQGMRYANLTLDIYLMHEMKHHQSIYISGFSLACPYGQLWTNM